jgi:hypothetical protein
MGRLHPKTFPLASLNASEARVVEALLDYLDNEWLVMPTVRIAVTPPVEIDIVIAHPAHGVGIIEVKGYLPRIEAGIWIEPYERPGGGPVAQMERNRFALRDLLRDAVHGASHVQVDGAIAFPIARGFATEQRPTEINEDQIIWSIDIDIIENAVVRFMNRGRPGRSMFGTDVFTQIVRTIRPSVEFEADPGAQVRWGEGRIESYSGAQIRVLERLDLNRRVYVTGGAGTGKSRLALAWARRAALRGERTLLVCFNEPLGAEFQRRVGEMENIRTGPFLRLALELEGMPQKVEPSEANSDYWNNEVQGHLHLHWPKVEESFDTIIVDEVQDFSPSWLAMLESLLDPDGPRRMLLAGDADQELHRRGFQTPRAEDGWTLCELVVNTRNSFGIARLLRNRLNGPYAPTALPLSTHIRFAPIEESEALLADSLLALVRNELLALRQAGLDDSSIAVVCLDRPARIFLRENPGFVSYEESGPGLVVCETVHRLKGLEYAGVILVASRWPVDDKLLYIGISRAVFGLSVIGPQALGERLRLVDA